MTSVSITPRINAAFCKLSEAVGQNPQEYASIVMAEISKRSHLLAEGTRLKDCLRNAPVVDIVAILKSCGHDQVKSWMVDTLMNTDVIINLKY